MWWHSEFLAHKITPQCGKNKILHFINSSMITHSMINKRMSQHICQRFRLSNMVAVKWWKCPSPFRGAIRTEARGLQPGPCSWPKERKNAVIQNTRFDLEPILSGVLIGQWPIGHIYIPMQFTANGSTFRHLGFMFKSWIYFQLFRKECQQL